MNWKEEAQNSTVWGTRARRKQAPVARQIVQSINEYNVFVSHVFSSTTVCFSVLVELLYMFWLLRLEGNHIVVIIIIINIYFMQGVYTYIPETNYVPREYSVAAILLLLFMVLIALISVLNLL